MNRTTVPRPHLELSVDYVTPAPEPEPEPEPEPGEEVVTGSASGSVGRDQEVNFQPLLVVPGTDFSVTMTGSGDPDLYVRFGDVPTRFAYDCRPYQDGPNESCSLPVPDDETEAYIMVRGYRSGNYTLEVTYTTPAQ